jgi:TonB family protein
MQKLFTRFTTYWSVLAALMSWSIAAQAQEATDPNSALPFKLPQMLEGGGEAAIVRAIQLRVTYPKQALRDGAQGQCMVTFAVSPSGQVCLVSMKYGIRADLDTAVVQAVRKMPQLQPAVQHNRPVACLLSAPVTFAIDNPQRLPKRPLPAIDSTQVYTAVTRMPFYRGITGFKQLSADLTAEYLRLGQATSCRVPRLGAQVVATLGPSGTLYDVQLAKSDRQLAAQLEAQFGDEIAKKDTEDDEDELSEACVAQIAEAARHLPRLTPAYVDGRPVAMRILLSLSKPKL